MCSDGSASGYLCLACLIVSSTYASSGHYHVAGGLMPYGLGGQLKRHRTPGKSGSHDPGEEIKATNGISGAIRMACSCCSWSPRFGLDDSPLVKDILPRRCSRVSESAGKIVQSNASHGGARVYQRTYVVCLVWAHDQFGAHGAQPVDLHVDILGRGQARHTGLGDRPVGLVEHGDQNAARYATTAL